MKNINTILKKINHRAEELSFEEVKILYAHITKSTALLLNEKYDDGELADKIFGNEVDNCAIKEEYVNGELIVYLFCRGKDFIAEIPFFYSDVFEAQNMNEDYNFDDYCEIIYKGFDDFVEFEDLDFEVLSQIAKDEKLHNLLSSFVNDSFDAGRDNNYNDNYCYSDKDEEIDDFYSFISDFFNIEEDDTINNSSSLNEDKKDDIFSSLVNDIFYFGEKKEGKNKTFSSDESKEDSTLATIKLSDELLKKLFNRDDDDCSKDKDNENHFNCYRIKIPKYFI